LTQYDLLTAAINRNGPVRRSNDDKTTFVEYVWFNGCYLFVLTINLRLSMDSLFDLLSLVSDDNLPLQKEALSDMSSDHQADIDVVLANQALICALVLQTDDFDHGDTSQDGGSIG
jgi:hypothetical protein